MDALLECVLEAHGGLDRWRNLSTLSARIAPGGRLIFVRFADLGEAVEVEATEWVVWSRWPWGCYR